MLGYLASRFDQPKREYLFTEKLKKKVDHFQDVTDVHFKVFRSLMEKQMDIEKANYERSSHEKQVVTATFVGAGLTSLSFLSTNPFLRTALKIVGYLSLVGGVFALALWFQKNPSKVSIQQVVEKAFQVKTHIDQTNGALAPQKDDTATLSSLPIADVAEVAIVSKPTHKEEFLKLTLTATDQASIGELISTLGNTSLLGLAFKKSRLTEVGETIGHVHPLRFLAVVVTDAPLRQAMQKIKASSMKWEGFVNGKGSDSKGFSQKFINEHRNGNFLPHVSGFCEFLELSKSHETAMVQFANEGKWGELIGYVLDQTD